MKKKPLPELEQKDGWHVELGIAARCKHCRCWINLGQPAYWRKTDEGTVIVCRECSDK